MDEIYDRYYYPIYYWAIKKTNNREDAEDLTNSVFVAIFEYFSKNIQVDKLEHLIWKIAHNIWCSKVKGYVKDKSNICYDETYDIGYQENMIDKIIYKEIVNNLDCINLTEKEKEAFQLYYLSDLSIKEISEKIHSSESVIKYYLYCARNKIKERYYG